MKLNIIKTKIIASLILIAVTLASCSDNKRVNHAITASSDTASFGIKYPQSQIVIKNITSSKLLEDNTIFNSAFVNAYNTYAASLGRKSKATFIVAGVGLNAKQPTWQSKWYVDLKFDLKKTGEKKYLVSVSFDFIYGPTENIYNERFQGEMAKYVFNELITGALNSID